MSKRYVFTKKTSKVKHYTMFGNKTLCGLIAVSGEEVLSPLTNCVTCLKEAINNHTQLALVALQLLKNIKQ